MLEGVFPGDSELAARMRGLDWTKTDLGEPTRWPQNMRTSLGLCLTSRIPVVMYWGPGHTVLYNDAYVSFLGPAKHPRVLGRPGQECWSEIWDTIGPMLESVRYSGKGTWSKDLQMFFARSLKLEEVFVRFTFGPILSANSRRVEGIFSPCTETTEQVVGARRLETLRRLGARPIEARTVEAACRATAEVLAGDPHDIPFAAIYLVDRAQEHASLVAHAGLGESVSLLPPSVALVSGEASALPFAAARRSFEAEEVRDLDEIGGPLPGGPYAEPSLRAVALPLSADTRDRLAGFLLVGVSPRRVLDPSYRTFFDLVAGHIGTAIADARAHEAERERSDTFLSNLSQELRGPLAPLGTMLEVVKRAGGDGEIVRLAHGTMERQLAQLVRVVDDLLDVSRLTRNRLELRKERVDLASVLREAIDGCRPVAESFGHELHAEIPDEPVEIEADPARLGQIFGHLLDNACKYTERGRIGVGIQRSDGWVAVRVADTGIGIPGDKLASVFEMFEQIDRSPESADAGLGIGLTLVRRLVEMHGGSIQAMSGGAGLGSEFLVRFPAPAALPVSAVPERRTAQLAELPKRILVVDDNPDSLSSLAMLLRLTGNETHIARDGLEAVAAAERLHPDVVLMDLGLPKLSGVDAARRIREQAWGKGVVIVALTGWGQDEDRKKSKDAGFDAHMVKPVNHDALMEVLATMKESA